MFKDYKRKVTPECYVNNKKYIIMNFGMISYEGLTEETFLLPSLEQPYLPGNKNNHPNMNIGLYNWDYQLALKKKNSPQPGTPGYYAKHFNAIALTETFEELPDLHKINSWYKAVVTEDFKICPQLHKAITHIGPVGLSKIGLTNDFITRVKGLKEKLGTSFMELPETLAPDQQQTFVQFLDQVPAGFDLSIEITNEEWFLKEALWLSFVKHLNSINKGLVITDTPGKRALVHMQLSNATAFIRFNCQGDHELDLFRIEQWQKQIKSWFLQGLQSCHFFVHVQNDAAEDDFMNYVKYTLQF
jgi:uncharacterized protein YecE (DUF72 family)